MTSLLAMSRLPDRALKESVRGRNKTFFYTSAPVTVPVIAGTVLGRVQTRINIDGDAHFICTGLSGSYLIQTTSLRTLPQLHAEPEVQLQEEGTGYLLFDRELRWKLVVGTGERVHELSMPYLFRSRSTVLVTFQNPETVAYTASITLSGYKLYL